MFEVAGGVEDGEGGVDDGVDDGIGGVEEGGVIEGVLDGGVLDVRDDVEGREKLVKVEVNDGLKTVAA